MITKKPSAKPAARAASKPARKAAKPARKAPRASRRSTPGLDYIAEPLRGLAVPLDRLRPNPANPRTHDARSVAAIAGSLKRFGQLKPIVIAADGTIEAGHGTLEAARQLGWTHLAAVRVDHDPRTGRAFLLADNRTADLAGWDDLLLADLLSDIQGPDQDDLLANLKIDELLTEANNAPESYQPEHCKQQVKTTPTEYKIVVDCRNERQQKKLFSELEAKGFACRVLTL